MDTVEPVTRSFDPDVRLLHALADPVRLSIVRQLSEEGTVCACDFTACAEVSQPTISHHLRVLRQAGWVTTERRGTWIHYALAPAAVERLRALAAELGPGASRAAGSLGPGKGGARRRLAVIQPTR